MRSPAVLALVSLALLCSACGHEAPAREPRRVEVIRPERRDLERTLDVPGTVLAYFQARLLGHAFGYVRVMHRDKGDPVREGDVIAEIDVPELVAARGAAVADVARAQAGLERARALVETALAGEEQAEAAVGHARALAVLERSLHERAKQLRASGDISIQDLEIAAGKRAAAEAQERLELARVDAARAEIARARSEVAVARAEQEARDADLREVEASLAFATVRAPFDGVVTERFVDPGDLIQRATRTAEAAQPIVTVTTRGRVRVDFFVPEAEVAYTRPGTSIEVSSVAYPDRTFKGEITRTASALAEETRTMLCEAELPNGENELLPGMFVTVRAVLETHPHALILPPDAITQRNGDSHCFIVRDEVARRVPVKQGWEFGDYLEVVEGLEGRELVILGGGELRDGDRVSPHPREWHPEPEQGPKRTKRRRAASGNNP